jgi:hypothetical protein
MDVSARKVGNEDLTRRSSFIARDQAFVGLDFSRHAFDVFASVGSRFEACNFDRISVKAASFGEGKTKSEYVGCSFNRAKLSMGPGGFTRFVDCSFREVDIRDWFCFQVEIVDCEFSGKLRRAFFNGRVPAPHIGWVGRTTNEFRGNDFSQMDFEDVDFRTGIDLRNQKLPISEGQVFIPDGREAIRRARSAVNTMNDLELRRNVMPHLMRIESALADGQEQFFFSKRDFPRSQQQAGNYLLDLLSLPSDPT